MTSRAAAFPAQGSAGAAGGARRAERVLWIAVGVGVLLVLAAATLRVQPNPILAAVVLPLVLAAYQRTLLA